MQTVAQTAQTEGEDHSQSPSQGHSQSYSKTDFGYKNVAIIGGVGAFLLLAGFLQGPGSIQTSSALSFSGYASEFDTSKPDYVFASLRPPKRSELADAIDFQTQSLKPGVDGNLLAGSAVLGAATFNPEYLKLFPDIKVKTTDDNSGLALATYAQQLAVIYENDNALQFFSAPMSKELSGRKAKFINDLKTLAVPSSLSDYHKLLVGYYRYSFMSAADSGTSAAGSEKFDQKIAAALPDIRAQLDLIKQSVQNSNSVSLPEVMRK